MAVTIKYECENWTPAFNPMVYVVESTNVGECEFRFICDIYVDSTFIHRLKTFPNADGFGIFKVQDILASYLSDQCPALADTWTALATHWDSYQLKFGEEYDNSSACDAGTTVYADLTNSAVKNFWLGGLSFADFKTYEEDTFRVGATDRRLLTNASTSQRVLRDGIQYLTSLVLTTASDRVQVTTYDSSGSLIGTYRVDNPYPTSSRMVMLGVGPYHLNDYTLISGSQPIITDSVYSYKVCFTDSSNNQASEEFTYTIDDRCTKFAGVHILYLNRLGGWETMYFTSNQITTVSVSQRKEFTQIAGTYTDGSPTGTWGYEYSDRGRKTFSVDANERRLITTNWMTEDESTQMRELITSPSAFLIENDQLVPILVTANEYEKYINRNKKMKQYSLSVDLSHGEVIQRL